MKTYARTLQKGRGYDKIEVWLWFGSPLWRSGSAAVL